MRPGDDDYEAQLEALRMLELERQAQVDAGTVGTNMPGAKVEFAPDSGMTPEPSRVPIQPKVVDLTTQPKGNLERSKAMRADWDNRSSQALERAGRELVAGLTRTQAAATSEWDTGHFGRFVADQERAAQREGRATQARLAGQKIDFDAKEAARKAATDEKRDTRDFAYRQEHDKESLAVARENAEATRAMAGAQFANTKKNQAGEDLSGLRKEFNALPDVKTFGEVDAEFKKIENVAANPSAAGDLALITSYMKVLDPGSSVKEGEFANAASAAGLPQQIVAQLARVDSGERLTPQQRKDFVAQARRFYEAHKGRYDAQVKRYSELARKQGAAPEDVTGLSSGAVRMRFPDGSEHDVEPGDVDLAKKKGGVPLGG